MTGLPVTDDHGRERLTCSVFMASRRPCLDHKESSRSDEPLPANPTATALPKNEVRQAATEKQGVVGGTSDLAKTVSGKVYQLADKRGYGTGCAESLIWSIH